MRVLMLNNEFPPLGGGTGTVNRELLLRFADIRNLSVDLITSGLGKKPETENFAENIRILKVPIGSKNIHHASNYELINYACRALHCTLINLRNKDYDLCFAWCSVPAGGIALALHRIRGLRYLIRVSGPDIPGFERRYSSIYPVLTPLIRSVWAGADVVVAKCTKEADMIRAIDRRPNIVIVPNGVDLDAFPFVPKPTEEGPLHLVCVARLIERKGQHHLVESLKRLKDRGIVATLDLVGTGDAGGLLKQMAFDLGIEDRVRFVGYVSRELIASFYSKADAFVLASYNEGMSVATLEAMAAGLPIVTTRTGGTEDLIIDGVNGFTFEWSDIEALTLHLQRLALDRRLIRRMGLESRIRAGRFSWDRAARDYLEIFARCASSPGDIRQHPVFAPGGRKDKGITGNNLQGRRPVK